MKDFKTLVQQRRSHRKFTEQEVSATDVQLILRAALMSPTAKNLRAWRFAVVDNKADIVKMADAKEGGAAFLAGAPLAIVVLGNPDEDECWIEDGKALQPSPCSIRPRNWAWAAAGYRCGAAAFLTEPAPTTSFTAYSRCLKNCRCCAFWPLVTLPMSAPCRTKTA